MRGIRGLLLVVLFSAGCTAQAPERGSTAADGTNGPDSAHQAHEAYVTAINSNDLDTLLGVLTDDVVFLSAHEAPMVGKAAVRPWLEAYMKAYKTHWDKPVQEFVVNGDWAFERYSYSVERHANRRWRRRHRHRMGARPLSPRRRRQMARGARRMGTGPPRQIANATEA